MSIVDKIYEYGDLNVVEISGEDVEYNEDFRQLCIQNSCGRYGKSYGCPPYVKEAKDMIADAKKYKRAIVYNTVHKLEDSYDFEGMQEAGLNHNKIAIKIKKYCNNNGIYDLISMGCGSCSICETCACLENKPCHFPEEFVPSTDSYCVYVSELAKTCGLKYINEKDTVTYFGLLLLRD